MTQPRAYYNEFDPHAAAWLRELIARNLIAPGDVDERSITDVQPSDLHGYTQHHFFAGIGGWSYALRLAGWPDDRAVWTGSCPCQPFSAAGRGEGADDARHLWPEWFRLLRERRPSVVFGEQVASAAGRLWLSAVRADLETLGYAVGGADLCAAGVGAPHIRQRLWFVADAGRKRWRTSECRTDCPTHSARQENNDTTICGSSVDHPHRPRLEGHGGPFGEHGATGRKDAKRHECETGVRGGVGDATSERHGGGCENRIDQPPKMFRQGYKTTWSDADWLPCLDGKARPVEPGTFPLAHGAPARVGRLRGYGNAIVPQVAQAFIEAYLDIRDGVTA